MNEIINDIIVFSGFWLLWFLLIMFIHEIIRPNSYIFTGNNLKDVNSYTDKNLMNKSLIFKLVLSLILNIFIFY